MKLISIIIPTLDEATSISHCLASLQAFREHGHEVIVVDGGSNDATVSMTAGKADLVLSAPRGRASQLNQGAKQANGELLVFLHADTLLPKDAESLLQATMVTALVWGRFDVRLSGSNRLLRVVEYFMNTRSRLTGIATGDQAIFVTRQLFELAGGFPDIELMEDISFSSTLKNIRPPTCLRQKVLTSSRRWEEYGIIKTVLSMWFLRLRYALGVSSKRLVRDYE